MAHKSIKNTLLSLSVAAALGCTSINLHADSGTRVDELETRVAELEALVTQLLLSQQEVAEVDVVVTGEAAEVVAEAKVNEMLAEHHVAEEAKAKKHSFKLGGYVKADVIHSDFDSGALSGNSGGREFYIPDTVPVGDDDVGESYLDLHAKESRINLKTEHNLDNGARMTTFVEIDFLLSGQGDGRVSNSYTPRLRHAFFTYNKWLFKKKYTSGNANFSKS